MCTDVEMHAPAILEDTMALARSYEHRLRITNDVTRAPTRPAKTVSIATTPTPPSNPAKPGAPNARPRHLSLGDGPAPPRGTLLQQPGEILQGTPQAMPHVRHLHYGSRGGRLRIQLRLRRRPGDLHSCHDRHPHGRHNAATYHGVSSAARCPRLLGIDTMLHVHRHN